MIVYESQRSVVSCIVHRLMLLYPVAVLFLQNPPNDYLPVYCTQLNPQFFLGKVVESLEPSLMVYNQWQKSWDTHHLKLVFLLSLKNYPLPPEQCCQ